MRACSIWKASSTRCATGRAGEAGRGSGGWWSRVGWVKCGHLGIQACQRAQPARPTHARKCATPPGPRPPHPRSFACRACRYRCFRRLTASLQFSRVSTLGPAGGAQRKHALLQWRRRLAASTGGMGRWSRCAACLWAFSNADGRVQQGLRAAARAPRPVWSSAWQASVKAGGWDCSQERSSRGSHDTNTWSTAAGGEAYNSGQGMWAAERTAANGSGRPARRCPQLPRSPRHGARRLHLGRWATARGGWTRGHCRNSKLKRQQRRGCRARAAIQLLTASIFSILL